MKAHFFKYRGRRIRYFNRYLWFCYYGFFLFPFLILLGWFSWKVFYPRLSTFSNWQMYLIPGISIVLYLLLVSGLILGLMHWSRLKEGYFASVYWRQLLVRMLIDNRFVYTKKQVSEKQTREKMR
ncbi:TPA: cell division protein FtsK, partial [Enterococcus faecium]